jgi:general secretion pathway protein C
MLEAPLMLWRPRLAANAPKIASLLLVGLMAAEAARFGRNVLNHRASSRPTLEIAGPTRHAAASGVNAQAITATHLFGIPPDALAAGAVNGPEIASNLKLEGTLARANNKNGVAIINADGTSRIYRVGETVGGSTLDAIYRDHVIMLRAGRFESLALPRTSSTSAAPVSAHVLPELPRRQRDLAALMRIGGSVEDEGGKLRGFRIYPGQNRRAFNATGLRGGDLVTAVNGQSLADEPPQVGKQAFAKIADSRNLTLTVERSGTARDITVDAAQEAADEGRSAIDP